MHIKRYSDAELKVFKDLILQKKEKIESLLAEFQSDFKGTSSNGTEDTMRTFDPEDGAFAETKTYLASQIYRCNKSLKELNDALLRIENKTYGVSIKTGELIPQKRLMCSLTAMF